jgi:hypothetical protein
MHKTLGFLMAIGLLAGVQAQAANLTCRAGENYLKATVLAEKGCRSGLVLMNVETICVDAASPAFSSLKPNNVYELCTTTQLDPSGTTWIAEVLSAREAN